MDSLGGKYLSEYNEVCKYLKRHAKKSEALSDALAELFEIYSAAQKSGAALEHIRGESLSDYEHALLEGLPKKEHPFLHRYIIAAAAVLIGVLTAVFRGMLLSYNGNIEIYVPTIALIECVTTGFLSYLAVALLHTRAIKCVPLAEALKVQE
mgnify:CR=1 FL=1